VRLPFSEHSVKRLVPARSVGVGIPPSINGRDVLASRLVVSLGELALGGHGRGGVSLVPGGRGSVLGRQKLLLLLLQLLHISVEEQVDRDLPGGSTTQGAAHAKDLTGKQPVHKTDRKLGLVVARDGAIDVLQRRVGVAQRDDRDAHKGGLLDGLGIDAGIGDHQQAGLLELLGLLVGEGSGGETAGNACSTSVRRVLEDSTLAERTAGDADHVHRVLDGNDDTGSNHKLLPGLAQVKDVKPVGASLPDIRSHLGLGVVGSDVDTSGEHALHVLVPVDQYVQARRKQVIIWIWLEL